jgi:hypothetical protein
MTKKKTEEEKKASAEAKAILANAQPKNIIKGKQQRVKRITM